MSIATKCTCHMSSNGYCNSGVKECTQLVSENKYPIGGYAPLPADDAVQNWFEENIDKECSASSAIYKFRKWLEALQSKPAGAVWVKASTRFPVLKHVIAKKFISYLNKEVVGTASSATGEMICFDWGVSSICLAVGHEELNSLEWLDESGTATVQYESVFVPCDEHDPNVSGGYTSNDGRSLCYVKEVLATIKK